MEPVVWPGRAWLFHASSAKPEVLEKSIHQEGSGTAPAGVDMAKTGHHHLLINLPVSDQLSPAR